MENFNNLNLSHEVLNAIQELGYEKPSEIQKRALPILLGEPTDFIGLAATGTGKTASYGIPLIEQTDVNQNKTQCLILCPTRELALQVTGQINLLGKFKDLKALSIYGGSSYGDQFHGLKKGAQIVVGTPGRIIDHLERGSLNLNNIQTIVLDEADEMISMGFKEDLETILESVPNENAKVWLFSATMSKEVRKIADHYLDAPKQVEINKKEVLSATVDQMYYSVKESDKPEILCKIIDAADDFYGIVFCQTKTLVSELTQYLHNKGYKVDCLHGDKDQRSREKTMQAFRNRNIKILICTDVASRGLDVKDVTHVINYSLPRELELYVHRIGRTARSGQSGVAISLVTPSHRHLIGRIEKMTKSHLKEGKIPTRRDIGSKKIAKILSQFESQPHYRKAMELLGQDWKFALADMSSEEVVGRFLNLISPDLFEERDMSRPLHNQQIRSEIRAEQQMERRQGRGGRKNRSGRDRHRDNKKQGNWKKNKSRDHQSAKH